MDFTNISQNYLSAIADKRNKFLEVFELSNTIPSFLSYLKSLKFDNLGKETE